MTATRTSRRHATGRAARLPGVALALAYVALCALPLVLALGTRAAPAGRWELAGAALGLVALGAMAVQFVTSGRFDRVSGRMGIDRIMAFHRVAALWVLLALVLHPVLFVLPTWAEDAALGRERLVAYLTLPHYRSGVIALGALALLVLTSVLRLRLPWTYEAWRATHLPLGLLAAGAGLHHAVTVGRFSGVVPLRPYWLAVAIGIACVVAVLYGWRWYALHRWPWRLRAVTRRAERMWELDIAPEPGTPDLPYRAGQFVWITEGRRRFPLFDHPFSIADSPARPGLSLLVKEAGDFTGRIGALPPGTPIGIDGPYGDFTLQAHPGDAVLLIAGGAGLGPIMGFLRDMVARRDPRPVRLAYAVGRPANLACLDEIAAAGAVLDLRSLFLSEETAPGWQGEVGRLDRERLGRLLDGLDPARTVAMICGPGGMVTAVSDMLLDLGMPMDSVVYERFDYGGGPASRQDRREMRRRLAVGACLALAVAAFAWLAG